MDPTTASLLQRICDYRILQEWPDLDLFLRKLDPPPPEYKSFLASVRGECLIHLRRR